MKFKVSDILPALDNVKEGAGGNYTARCPAHEDKDNSFSIGSDAEGFAVCNCFAGCSQADIWDAIYNLIGKPEKEDKRPIKRTQKPVCSYYYKNEAGEVIDIKNRFEPGFNGKSKSFTWSVTAKKRREALPLYHLADIMSASEVYAVEGEKDADTLQRLGLAATTTKDGFTSDNMKYLTGKAVYILEDNDNAGHKFARNAADICRASAASVKVVNIAAFFPALPSKGDITDFVEMKGSIEDLKAYIDTLPEYITDPEKAEDNGHPHAAIWSKIEHYAINKKGALIYSNGDNVTPVCFGSLAILEEIRKNDGEGSALFFKVQGVTEGGRVLPSVLVKASELAGFAWLADAYGSEIIPAPTNSAKQKLAAGVLMTGRQAIKKTIYTATGYLMDNGKPTAYIHAGGHVNGSDTLEADIQDNLKAYTLQDANTSPENLKGAARSSLRLLEAHAPGVVYPLFAFVYLAPLLPVVNDCLGDTGFCLYLQGKTQSGKSTLAALALSHFGKFTAMTPPTSFNSTANYINELAFILKDSILWVDDFHPQGTKREADKQAQIFQHIARAAGDHSSRGRLNSNAKIQTLHRPRCLFLATGEDTPQIGQSGIARLFTLQVTKSREDITTLRKDARDGVLSRAMSDYISFIISHYEDVKRTFTAFYNSASDKAIKAYSENRLSAQAALLYTSAKMYLSYAKFTGVISEDTAKDYKRDFEKNIFKAAEKINDDLYNTDPVQMYMKALRALISSGRRYIINLEAKTEAGYFQAQSLGADNTAIGWKDKYFFYMDPNATFTAICEYYKGEGTYFNISRQTLQREAMDAGYIIGSGKDPTTQKRINGNNTRVLKFARATLEEADALEGGG